LEYIKDGKSSKTPATVTNEEVFEHVKAELKAKKETASIVAWIQVR
jgi:hypothetical protein